MSGLLIREQFVAVFPSLVRALGSIESAVILQHLHFLVGDDGTTGPVTAQQISDATGIAERTVRRRLENLREVGVLTSSRATSMNPTQVHEIDYTHQILSARDGQSDHQPVKVAVTTTKKKEEVLIEPPGFAEWWALYPRKVAKPHARKCYAAAVKQVGPGVLLAALERQRPNLLAARTRDPKQDFCPHPATWLNHGQWEDDVGPAPVPHETFKQRVAKANSGGGPRLPPQSHETFKQRVARANAGGQR